MDPAVDIFFSASDTYAPFNIEQWCEAYGITIHKIVPKNGQLHHQITCPCESCNTKGGSDSSIIRYRDGGTHYNCRHAISCSIHDPDAKTMTANFFRYVQGEDLPPYPPAEFRVGGARGPTADMMAFCTDYVPWVPMNAKAAKGSQRVARDIPASRPPFLRNMVSLAQLVMFETDIDFLIEGVLVRGESLLISGLSKTLKTTITMDMVLSLATGLKFLNHYEVVEKTNSLFLSAESGLPVLSEMIPRMLVSKGFCTEEEAQDQEYLSQRLEEIKTFVNPELPAISDPAHMRELKNVITEHSLGVCAVDPAYLAIPSDYSKLQETGAILGALNQEVREVGATLVLLHHDPRGSAKDAHGHVSFQSAGASFDAFFRCRMGIRRWDEKGGGAPQYTFGRHGLTIGFSGSVGISGELHVIIDEGVRNKRGDVRRYNVYPMDVPGYPEVLTQANQEEEAPTPERNGKPRPAWLLPR